MFVVLAPGDNFIKKTLFFVTDGGVGWGGGGVGVKIIDIEESLIAQGILVGSKIHDNKTRGLAAGTNKAGRLTRPAGSPLRHIRWHKNPRQKKKKQEH